jgi:hypothetical protein
MNVLIAREQPLMEAAAEQLQACLKQDGYSVTVGTLTEEIVVYIHREKNRTMDAIPPKWKGYPVEVKFLGTGHGGRQKRGPCQ